MKKRQEDASETLLSLGLSRREVGVYIALLELGHGTVTQISRKAGINRTTGYDILDALAHKNLARLSGKEPKEEYVAESPEKLVTLLDEKLAETQKQLILAKEFLPQLKAMHTVQDRPQVRFYEGVEGLKEVYEDTLTSPEPIRAYACIDDMHKALPNYFPEYYKRRARKGISIRGIVPETKTAMAQAAFNAEEKRDIAFVPADKYYFSPEINIYANKVMVASWREKLGIIIESAEIADAMKKIYELAWAEAKRLDAANSPVST
ncbi:MAG: helix-turn-helix domain-containing protein [bacterium]